MSATTTAARAAETPARAATSPTGSLEELVEEHRIDTVLLATGDQQGRLQGKEYDARTLVERLGSGALSPEMCGYVLGTDLGMTPPADGPFSWQSGFGDVALLPDVENARVLPWLPGTALVLADPVSGGCPHPLAPGTVLAEQLHHLVRLGPVPLVGIETEFVLYEGTARDAAAAGWRGLRPAVGRNGDYALDQPPAVREFGRRLRRHLAGAGLPVEAVKGESGHGQVEVTFPYGQATDACEQHVLFKHAAKTIAEEQGLTASFMAAPSTGVGSGMHLHVSLHDSGGPLLAADPAHGTELSELGGHAVAGLLTVLPELAPLWAPYVNSYKRLQPHSFAPARLAWGRDNRTCAVRVVGHGPSLRLEVRLPGADANPLLALAAVLAGIRHGIAEKLTPPPATVGDAYRQHDAPLVPRSLEEALARFETSALAGELLGEPVVAHLARVARMDLDHHAARVTDAEVERGLTQA
ncbi:glutamine synthetase family protein [Kitasatospora cheerisanensis]|uniref:Glutamate-ammonia ligase n=1 Tax=Kitasatospora cheerisanensis KCTC 2395 TaxID=1348663 RepID=A0A066YW00_9ACTN|nr:glutamine synthetase family protein [Kitasatospora cheerisanensis]KDN85683.1 glutamate-ammonia ligase [Kitasatospora cheerisanensis KCTC 2395]